MPARRVALLVCLMLCSNAPSAFGQSHQRGFAHADFGYGSMEDDEGSLGSGLAFGAAIGGALIDAVQAEFSVTRLSHQRSVAIGWQGHVTSYTGRLMYRSGRASSSLRWVAGAGAGYYSYEGTISETIFPTLAAGPVVDRFNYSFQGLLYETGGGLEIATGRNLFVRPELWVTIPRGRSAGGRTPQPPFLIARLAVVTGLRF